MNIMFNIFFPVPVLHFLPPLVFAVLIINFAVDSLALLIGLRATQIRLTRIQFFKTVCMLFSVGLIADFVGAIIYLLPALISSSTGGFLVTNEMVGALMLNVFSNYQALAHALLAVCCASVIIYLVDYKILTMGLCKKKQAQTIALLMAFITAPWTFLIPTTWFVQ